VKVNAMALRDEVRAQWLKQLLSTDPADRPAAEAAISDLYVAGEFIPPGGALWFDSPFEASWAVALLVARHNPTWRDSLESSGRLRDNRSRIDRMRSTICERLNASDWESASSTAGNALGVMLQYPPAAGQYLQMAVADARMSLSDDLSVIFGQVTEDDLEKAESRFWKSARAVLASEVHCPTTAPLVGLSFFNEYSFSMMADDEARIGRREPPAILSAAWRIGRSAGLWWPFAGVAILSDRPVELHVNDQKFLHRGDGPAAIYRDGWRVYAWEGMALPEKLILTPETIPERELRHLPLTFRKYVETRAGEAQPQRSRKRPKPSPILTKELPSAIDARIETLRAHANGRLPLLERYTQGRHQEVWSELVGLGAKVREDPFACDALAVAYETMRRVENNIRTIVSRLIAMNYTFATEESRAKDRIELAERLLDIDLDRLKGPSDEPHVSSIFDIARRARDMLSGQIARQRTRKRNTSIKAHVPPDVDVWKRITRLEKDGYTLPLSLRAFYEVVGSVDFIGSHPALAPPTGSICPDPLVVFAVDEALLELESEEEHEENGGAAITIAPDDLHKADTSGGDPYEIAVPELRADGELLNERHHLLFVDYLRLCFRFGGFPGFDGVDDVPGEIKTLREGLLEL
jgi:hypothetical protein